MQKITFTLYLSLTVVVVASAAVDVGDDTKGKIVVFWAIFTSISHRERSLCLGKFAGQRWPEAWPEVAKSNWAGCPHIPTYKSTHSCLLTWVQTENLNGSFAG